MKNFTVFGTMKSLYTGILYNGTDREAAYNIYEAAKKETTIYKKVEIFEH